MTHQQTSILDYFGLLNKQWHEFILWENCLKLLDCSTYADVFTPFYFSGAFWCCQSANRSDGVAWSTPLPQSVRWICHFAAAAPSAKRQFPCRIVRFGDEVPLCFPHISLIMAWQVFFLCFVAASAHLEPEQTLRLLWMVLNNAWDGLMYSYLRSSFVLGSGSGRQSNSHAVANILSRTHVKACAIAMQWDPLTKDPFGLCRAGCFWLSQWHDCVLVYEARLGRPARLIRLCLIHFHTALMKPLRDEPKDSTVTWLLVVHQIVDCCNKYIVAICRNSCRYSYIHDINAFHSRISRRFCLFQVTGGCGLSKSNVCLCQLRCNMASQQVNWTSLLQAESWARWKTSLLCAWVNVDPRSSGLAEHSGAVTVHFLERFCACSQQVMWSTTWVMQAGRLTDWPTFGLKGVVSVRLFMEGLWSCCTFRQKDHCMPTQGV